MTEFNFQDYVMQKLDSIDCRLRDVEKRVFLITVGVSAAMSFIFTLIQKVLK